MKTLCFVLALMILSPAVFAWGSVLTVDTHKDITKDVIDNKLTNDITENEYPDIIRFKEKLKDGSGTESHVIPGDVDKWAPPPELWYTSTADDCALKKYQSCDFLAAYYDLGRELHLRQDIFVPAHEKVCYHSVDDMELLAHLSHHYSNTTTPKTFNLNFLYPDENGELYTMAFNFWLSDAEDDDNFDELPNDPVDEAQQDGPNAYNIMCTWGTYGMPPYYKDLMGTYVLLELLPGLNSGNDFYEEMSSGNLIITYEALQGAYTDTLSFLKARSEGLPPIIPDNTTDIVSVMPSLFGPNLATQISFSVMENRKKTVRMTIKASESAIKDKDTPQNVWDGSENATFDLDPCADADQLPFCSIINIDWDGSLNAGSLSDGQHTVTIQVEDANNQLSEIRSRSVRYDATKPTGTIKVDGI
ncbi:MAG: hypothetical protein WC708_05705 [Lentisphaeria bacterium]